MDYDIEQDYEVASAYEYFDDTDEEWVDKQLEDGENDGDLIEKDLERCYPDRINIVDFFEENNGHFRIRVLKPKK